MGLYVQRDGINLAQKALDVTGNNIANSKTKGYTRQKLDLVSARVYNSTLGYSNQVFLAGAGVEGPGVTQTRNEIEDVNFRTYSGTSAHLAVKSNVLSAIEDAIDDIEIDTIDKGKEENKTGFAKILQDFKASWQAFSSQGTDQTDLANIARANAQNVIEVLHDFSNRIENISDRLISDTIKSAEKVNSILKECAALNESIQSGYIGMGNFYDNNYGYQADITYGPLEIKDKMNSLIDDLSTYADVSSKIEKDGTFTISICGKEVVNHMEYAKLTYIQDINYYAQDSKTAEITKIDNGDGTFSYKDADGNAVTDQKIIDSLKPKYVPSGDHGEPVYTYSYQETAEDGTVTDKTKEFVLQDDGKYYSRETGEELKNQDIIDALTAPAEATNADGAVMNSVTADGIIVYDKKDIPPTKLSFQLTAMKSESKWKASNIRFEKGTDFPDDEYRAAMYDALSKGEFNEAYNMERQMTNNYTYFSKMPADYVPVFGKRIDITNAKEKITDITADLKEGSLKGDLDMYNGAYSYAVADPITGENIYKGVEYYRQTFNEFTKTIVNAFNDVYTKNGLEEGDFKMFEFYTDEFGNEIQTASQVKVAKTFEDNPIRAVHPEYKDSGDITDETNFDQIANTWVNRITSVFEAKHTFGKESNQETFEDFVIHYGNTLGKQLEDTNRSADAEFIHLEGAEAARLEDMGVSKDEEGVHMLNNQKWYNAMARMITTLDQLLEKLINGTGVVGL